MKRLIIILLLSGGWGGVVHADICFDQPVASAMLMELEQCRIDKEQTVPILHGMTDSLNTQLTLCDRQLTDAMTALSKQEEITELVKPSVWDRIQDFGEDALLTLTVIGGIAAVILLNH